MVKLAEMERKQATIWVFFGISFINIINLLLIIYCNNFKSMGFFLSFLEELNNLSNF